MSVSTSFSRARILNGSSPLITLCFFSCFFDLFCTTKNNQKIHAHLLLARRLLPSHPRALHFETRWMKKTAHETTKSPPARTRCPTNGAVWRPEEWTFDAKSFPLPPIRSPLWILGVGVEGDWSTRELKRCGRVVKVPGHAYAHTWLKRTQKKYIQKRPYKIVVLLSKLISRPPARRIQIFKGLIGKRGSAGAAKAWWRNFRMILDVVECGCRTRKREMFTIFKELS